MRPSLSQRKKQLIVRVAASRLEMLDSGLRLSHDVTSLPTRVASKGRDMLKLATAKVKQATPKTPSNPSSPSPQAASKLQLTLLAMLSAGVAYLVWRFSHLKVGQLFYKALRLLASALKDAWRKLVWPLLRSSLRACWKSMISK